MNIQSIPGFTEPFSSISHLLASFSFLIIGMILVQKSFGNKSRVFSLGVFAASNIFLFAMSGVYHLLEKGSTANYVLQILDHDGIFLLIAGTFTPLHAILTRGYSRWPILVVVWLIGINGVVFTSIFFSDMPH
jgi:channel protein (hemolysin III family)